MFNPNQQQQQQPQSNTSIFGSAAPFSTGNTQSSTGLFGAPSGTPFASTPFGASSSSNQQPFGSSSASSTNQQPFASTNQPSSAFGSSAFGSPLPSSSQPFGASNFGFGGATSNAPTAPSTGSGFFGSASSTGSSNPTSSSSLNNAFGQQGTAGGLFGGGNAAAATPSSNSFFGGSTTSQPSQIGGGSSFFSSASPAFGAFGTGTLPSNPISSASSNLFSAARPAGTGLFGNHPISSSVNSSPFSSNPQSGALPGMQNGTGNPSFSQTSDIETDKTVFLQSISAMPSYKNKSFEELRWEDYQKGSKWPGFPSTAVASSSNVIGGGSGMFNSSPFNAAVSGANSTTSSGNNSWFTPSSGGGNASTGGFNASPFATPTASQQPFGNAPLVTSFQQSGNSLFPSTSTSSSNVGGGSFFQAQQPSTSLFNASKPASGFSAFPAASTSSSSQPTTTNSQASGGLFSAVGNASLPQFPASSTTATTTGATPFSGSSFFNTPAPAPSAGAGSGQTTSFPTTSSSAFAPSFPTTTPLQQTPTIQTPATGGFSGFNFTPSTSTSTAAAAAAKPSIPSSTTTSGSSLFNFTPSTTSTTSTPSFNAIGGGTFFTPNAAASNFAKASTIDSNPYGAAGAFPTIPQISTSSSSSASTQLAQPATPSAGAAKTRKPLFPKSAIKFKPQSSYFSTANPSPASSSSSNSQSSTGSSILSELFAEGKKTGEVKKLVIEFAQSPQANSATSFPIVESSSSEQIESKAFVDSSQAASSSKICSSSGTTAYGNESFTGVFDSEQNVGQGHYFSNPPLSQLAKLEPSHLKSISNFRVGRKGVGSVEFLVPVDLSSVPLDKIFGGIVQFTCKQISIYPEDSSIPKAEVGSGLNLPAKVVLYGCWPVDSVSKNPISQNIPDDILKAHLRKLALAEDCDFVDFDPQSGAWTFKVNHFSSYSCPEDEDSRQATKAQQIPHSTTKKKSLLCCSDSTQLPKSQQFPSLTFQMLKSHPRGALADSGLFFAKSTRACFTGNGKLLVFGGGHFHMNSQNSSHKQQQATTKILTFVNLFQDSAAAAREDTKMAFDFFVLGKFPISQSALWKLAEILNCSNGKEEEIRPQLVGFLEEQIKIMQANSPNSNDSHDDDISTKLLLGDVSSAVESLKSQSKFRLAAVLQQIPLSQEKKKLLSMQIPTYSNGQCEEAKVIQIACGLWNADFSEANSTTTSAFHSQCPLQRFLYNLKFSSLSIGQAWKQARCCNSRKDKISSLLDLLFLNENNDEKNNDFELTNLSSFSPIELSILYSLFHEHCNFRQSKILILAMHQVCEMLLESFGFTSFAASTSSMSMMMQAVGNYSKISNLMIRKGIKQENISINASEEVAHHLYAQDVFSAFKVLLSREETYIEACKLYLLRIMPSNLMLQLTAATGEFNTQSSASHKMMIGAKELAAQFSSNSSFCTNKFIRLAIAFESLFENHQQQQDASEENLLLEEMFQFLDDFYHQHPDQGQIRHVPAGEMIVWNGILDLLCEKVAVERSNDISILNAGGNWKSQQVSLAIYSLALKRNATANFDKKAISADK